MRKETNVRHRASVLGPVMPYSFAFWDAQDAFRTGATTMTAITETGNLWLPGREALPDLDYIAGAGAGTLWSARDGWLTFPGAVAGSGDYTMFRELMSDVPEYQSALELGDGCILVAAHVKLDVVSGGAMDIISVGRNSATSATWAFQVSNGIPRIVLRDTDGTNQTINGNNFNNTSLDTVFCAFIDNRPSVKSCWVWGLGTDGRVATDNPTTIYSVGSVPWETDSNANQQLSIGGCIGGSGDLRYLDGEMQRLLVVNYGTSPPNDMSGRMVKLMENRCKPGEYLYV